MGKPKANKGKSRIKIVSGDEGESLIGVATSIEDIGVCKAEPIVGTRPSIYDPLFDKLVPTLRKLGLFDPKGKGPQPCIRLSPTMLGLKENGSLRTSVKSFGTAISDFVMGFNTSKGVPFITRRFPEHIEIRRLTEIPDGSALNVE